MPIRVRSTRPAPAVSPLAVATSTALPFGLPVPPPQWPQKPPGITLCMIVKNEERFLEQCLRSVEGVVDEMVVVDTGSTDRTMEIARSFGATVVERPWRNDFAWARNQANELATKRWILQLDADEELTPESRAELARLKNVPAYNQGVWIRCHNKSDDYAGTGSMTHALVRIFPNHERIRFRGLIHEFITLDDHQHGLEAGQSSIAIVHHGYLKEVVQDRNKGERNLAIVRAATENDPAEPFNWFNLGTTAYAMGDNETALMALEKMFELNGLAPRGFMANGLAVLSEVYLEKRNDAQRALQAAEQCLAFSPHYANAHFMIGKAYVAMRRFDDARAAFAEAIEDGKYIDRQFVVDNEVAIWKAHSEIGTTYVMQGDDEKAIEWFERGIANRPTVQPIRLNRAKALERLERYTEAEEAFRDVYDDFKDEFSTVNYIDFLLRRHSYERAIEIIEESHQRLTPRTAVTVLCAAALAAGRHGWDDISYLEKAAAILPGCADALNPLEARYRARGDGAALARLLERERETQPEEAADFIRRVLQRLGSGDFPGANDLAAQGLARFPGDVSLRYHGALAAVNLGRRDEALALLEAVDECSAEWTVRVRYLSAVLLRESDRLDESLSNVDRALAAQPDFIDGIVLRAHALESLGRHEDAETSLRAAMPMAKQQIGVELAALYLRQGKIELAGSVAQAALA